MEVVEMEDITTRTLVPIYTQIAPLPPPVPANPNELYHPVGVFRETRGFKADAGAAMFGVSFDTDVRPSGKNWCGRGFSCCAVSNPKYVSQVNPTVPPTLAAAGLPELVWHSICGIFDENLKEELKSINKYANHKKWVCLKPNPKRILWLFLLTLGTLLSGPFIPMFPGIFIMLVVQWHFKDVRKAVYGKTATGLAGACALLNRSKEVTGMTFGVSRVKPGKSKAGIALYVKVTLDPGAFETFRQTGFTLALVPS